MPESKDTIAELIKTGLAHSIAQTFLIFSSALVIVSLIWAKEFVPVTFFTLFYALINFKMEALRRHESLGRYAVGSDPLQIIQFTITSFFHSVWWITGVATIIFAISGFPDKFVECFGLSSIDLFCSLVFASVLTFVIAFIMTFIWLCRMFFNKWKVEKNIEGYYCVKCFCRNCGLDNQQVNDIPKKRLLHDHPCPNCGSYELKQSIQKKLYKTEMARCNNCGQFSGEVEIPKGLAYNDLPCPNCNVADLKK